MRRTLLILLFLLAALPPPLFPETGEVQNLSNRRYFAQTLEAVQNARRSIFFVMYHLPFDPSNRASPVTRLMESLIEAKARGVAVRVVLDQEVRADRSPAGDPMKNLRAYHFLKENGVEVSFDSLGKRTHAKLLVIDEETVILGSTNWSREALEENYEANLLVRSPETARALLEDFKAIEPLAPERAPVAQEFFRISRNFLLDKRQGPRFLDEHAERAAEVYLVILSGAATHERLREGSPTVDPSPLTPAPPVPRTQDDGLLLDYEKIAGILGMEKMSREAYRRQIIKVLKKLDRDYGLLRFEPRHGKEAGVTLLDPARPGEDWKIPESDYFEVPRALFSHGWLRSLSLRALYALLILDDQQSYPRVTPAIKVGLETLEKRYFADIKTLGEGSRELARQNLVEIHYGRAIDFAKREFETASYILLPFYDPAEREKRLRGLAALYGEGAFKKSQKHARAFFKEKDPETIETLLGLRLTYSPEWVDRAMKKVILKKKVGNPARSLPYLIGILKQWKEQGRPTLATATV